MKKIELSKQMRIDLRAAAERCAKTLKEIMDIGSFDSVRLSLDLNRETTGRLCGIKYSVFTAERAEEIYDTDLEG